MKKEKAEKISKEINKVAVKGIKEIEKIQGGLEINKSELVRDLALSLIVKIQEIYKSGDMEKLKNYDKLVAVPITTIIDVARKTNRDIFEMKHGKKINVVKKGLFEDEINGLINITPEKVEDETGDKK